MANEWEIKSRGHQCAVTGRDFVDGEPFYTLLFRERNGDWRREDLCEEAWRGRGEENPPFSFWRGKYEAPVPEPPQGMQKATAEELLRQLMEEPGDSQANLRYLLALMLERKRVLKPIETREADGQRLLIYEHRATGEAFIIPDPQLRLEQLEAVQAEVAERLG